MINQDWEYEAQKDLVYLQERIELLKQELREEAIIYSSLTKSSENANQQVANIQIVTPEGIQSGSDIHSDSGK